MQLERTGRATPAVQWVLKRNCALSPLEVLRVYALLCLVCLGIGLGFWWLGAPAVLPFAGLEVVALGVALWFYTRHASDQETMTLVARELEVEHRCGTQVQRVAFRAEWLSVEPTLNESSLVELSGQGQRMQVGRYLRPELRMALARELRAALRRAKDPVSEPQS